MLLSNVGAYSTYSLNTQSMIDQRSRSILMARLYRLDIYSDQLSVGTPASALLRVTACMRRYHAAASYVETARTIEAARSSLLSASKSLSDARGYIRAAARLPS